MGNKKPPAGEEKIQKAFKEWLNSLIFSHESGKYDCFRAGWVSGRVERIVKKCEK